jgi:hypothetical protein
MVILLARDGEGRKASQQNQFTITSLVMKEGITTSIFGNP